MESGIVSQIEHPEMAEFSEGTVWACFILELLDIESNSEELKHRFDAVSPPLHQN